MDLSILKIEHKQRNLKKDKAKTYVNGYKNDFISLRPGDYALVKIETLSDRMLVEEFIEKLKNR